MEFDLKTMFSIFIAVLMVGSIVGFTAFYSFPDQTQPANGDKQQPTAIEFTADEVEATVQQMLPSITVQAETMETDLIALNTSIYAIEGVKRVSGRFVQQPYTVLGTGFVYLADISFALDLNSSHILEQLEDKAGLQNIGGYNFALLQLPKTVSMHSIDQALDLTREYTFSENITEALILFGSQPGDVLQVSVTATFVGERATNVMAFEEENLTAKPVQKQTQLELPIESLETTLLFDATPPYSLLDSISSLELEANEIAGIVDANVFFSGPEPKVSITFDSPVEETLFSGIEQFIKDLNAQFTKQDELNVFASFEDGITSQHFSEKIALIEAEMQQLAIEATVAEHESGFLSGEASLDSVDSKQPGSDLSNLLESKGLEFNLMQPGQLALDKIFDPDSQQALVVEAGTIPVFLSTGHQPGDTVSVEVSYVLVRGEIDSARATEE